MQKDTQEDILISVIIPIHNAGIWLKRCLDTLINQTLRELEFICVLDCPTDGSDKIVLSYASDDARFVVINNEINLGIAESRNAGIRISRGKYIGFSDHDDWRELDMYEKLFLQAMKSNSDVVLSAVCIVREDSTEIIGFEDKVQPKSLLTSIVLPVTSKYCKNKLARSVWHSIYKRSFIVNNGIVFFDRKTFFEEDSLFNFQVFIRTNFITQLKEAFYQWNWNRVENSSNYSESTTFQSYVRYYQEIKRNLSCTQVFNAKESKKLLSHTLSMQFYNKYHQFKLLNAKTISQTLKNDVFLLRVIPALYMNEKTTVFKQLMTNYFLLIKFSYFILKLKVYVLMKMI